MHHFWDQQGCIEAAVPFGSDMMHTRATLTCTTAAQAQQAIDTYNCTLPQEVQQELADVASSIMRAVYHASNTPRLSEPEVWEYAQ